MSGVLAENANQSDGVKRKGVINQWYLKLFAASAFLLDPDGFSVWFNTRSGDFSIEGKRKKYTIAATRPIRQRKQNPLKARVRSACGSAGGWVWASLGLWARLWAILIKITSSAQHQHAPSTRDKRTEISSHRRSSELPQAFYRQSWRDSRIKSNFSVVYRFEMIN